MIRPVGLLSIVVLLLAAACGGGAGPTISPGVTPTPGPPMTLTELRLELIDVHGPLWYCDPDFWPLQRQEELDSAKERWSEVTADAVAFGAIAAEHGVDVAGPFTDAERLALYRTWKVLQAIALDPIGNDTYRFDYLAQPAPGATDGIRTGGTISTTGVIRVEQQAAAGEPICPICLGRGTRIDGPSGSIAVDDIRIGDPVWTLDGQGQRVAGTVVAIGSTVAPANHHVIRLVLADGRAVTASPGHPLADGRVIGDLRRGDPVDGSLVASADLLPYEGGMTFDLLVGGPTGAYFTDGIPLGSTLRP